MALQDFIDNIRYRWRDVLKEGKEVFVDNTIEAAQSIGEIATDGVYEIVVKDNENYKTSFEKRDEAKRTVAKAEKRYTEARKRFEKKLEMFKGELVSYDSFVERLLSGSVARWCDRAENWGIVEIKSIAEEHSLRLTQLSTHPLSAFQKTRKSRSRSKSELRAPDAPAELGCSPTLASAVVPGMATAAVALRVVTPLAGPASVPLLLAQFWASKRKRVAAADNFSEDAEDFMLEVKKQEARFKKSANCLKAVSLRMEESKYLLQTFEDALRKQLGRIRVSRKLGRLTGKSLERAQLAGLAVSAIVALAGDALMDTDGQPVEQNERLHLEIREAAQILHDEQ